MPHQCITIAKPDAAVEPAEYIVDGVMDAFHRHPGYMLFYQCAGATRWATPNGTHILAAGGLLLLGAGQPHRVQAMGEAPARGLALYFSAPYLEPLQAVAPLGAFLALLDAQTAIALHTLDGQQQNAVEAALRQLRQWQGETACAPAYRLLLGTLLLFLHPLCAACPQAVCRSRAVAGESLADLVQSYIAGHYAQPLSLGGLAEAFAVSPCYLSRAFKQRVGVGLNAYLNTVRVKAAQALLQDIAAAQDLDAVGRRCGFGTSAHFRRAFKAVVGLSPQQYRKRCRAAAGKKTSPRHGAGR